MNAARISHEDLEAYAAWLAERRDAHLATVAREPEDSHLAKTLKGHASGYAVALDALFNFSDGAYGQRIEEQRGFSS